LTCGGDKYCHGDGNLDHCGSTTPDGGSPDGGNPDALGVVPGGPYNTMFVTSTTYMPGTLASHGMRGIDYADAECNRLALAATPPISDQHFVAWLSDSTAEAGSRVGSANGWVRRDGRPFATSAQALKLGAILFPPRLDESGNDLVSATPVFVATGSNADGTRAMNANDWSSTSTGCATGDANQTTAGWLEGYAPPGNAPAHLYCFGTSYDRPLGIVNEMGRLAFLSHAAFTPGGNSPDAFCQAEATANRLPGSYLALLLASASGTASAASRFDLAGPTWIRPDGIPWMTRAGALAQGNLLTALNVDLDGSYRANIWAWTGGTDPTRTVGSNCSDWHSSSNTQTGTVGTSTNTNAWFFDNKVPAACDSVIVSLYCLQE
jgi:hypothetical protein